MPLRLIEATVPGAELDSVPEILDGASVVQTWTWRGNDGRGLVQVLLSAEQVEAVSDLLVERFGSHEAFRIILLPVEATLPSTGARPAGPVDAEKTPGKAPGPKRISREELYEDVAQASRLTPVYVVMVGLSTVVAAVGLIRGDVAIIIGAMVIAPLLGPNMALALAATLGDTDLARRSLRTIAAGISTAAAAALLMGLLFHVDPSAPEVAARTRVGFPDIALGLAAGAAGSLAFTSGVPAVVVGVMVAVALLPPLVVAGLLVGAGHWPAALPALTLLVTNVTCVNLAAVATFLAQRVRPRTWWEADRARKATRIAVTSWIIMLAVLLGLIAFGALGTL